MRATRTLLTTAFAMGISAAAVVGTTGVAHAEKATFVNPDYVGAETVVQGEVVSQPAVLAETVTACPTCVEAEQGTTLPLTGGDVAALSIAGVAMVGAGIPLVRRGRRRA